MTRLIEKGGVEKKRSNGSQKSKSTMKYLDVSAVFLKTCLSEICNKIT